MGNDKTNMIVAIALSLAVLLGWNYFIAAPRVEQQRQAALQNKAATQPAGPDGVPSASPKEGGPANPVPGTLPGASGAGGGVGVAVVGGLGGAVASGACRCAARVRRAAACSMFGRPGAGCCAGREG